MNEKTKKLRISKFVIDDVADTIARYQKTGRRLAEYQSLRQFYVNVLYEKNQYMTSVRAMYAYEFIRAINGILNDDFDIDNLIERATFLTTKSKPTGRVIKNAPKNAFKEAVIKKDKPSIDVGLDMGVTSPPTGNAKKIGD